MPAQRFPQQPINRGRLAPAPGNGAVPRHPPQRPPVPANGHAPRQVPRPVPAAANGREVRPQPRAAPHKPHQPAAHVPSFVPILHAPTFRRLVDPSVHLEDGYEDFDDSWDDSARGEYQKLSHDITEILYTVQPFEGYSKKPNLKRTVRPVRYAQPKY